MHWARFRHNKGVRMNDEELRWAVDSRRELLRTPVFRVVEQRETAASGYQGRYLALDAADWVATIGVHDGCFIMVRQWRHGAEGMTLEFPGGLCEAGEDPAEAAAREYMEETGYRVGKITKLATCNPNPALFKNHLHFFLAEELTPTGVQHTDADEYIQCVELPVADVIRDCGSGEYYNAFLGTALMLYMRHCAE